MSEWTLGAGEHGGHEEVIAHDVAHKAGDWRVYQIEKLGLERVAEDLEKAHARWVQVYQDWEEAKLWVWAAKRELEDLEKTLLSEMDETAVQSVFAGVRSSQPERDKRRQAMMEQDPRFQSKSKELQDAETAQRKAEMHYNIAEEERKHLRMGIGWRQALVDFWRTVARVPIIHAPDQDGVAPAPAVVTQPAPVQPTGSVHDVPQVYTEEATARWVANMESDLIRYGPGGRLALQVLPAGVNPDDPRVMAVRADIAQHFRERDAREQAL